MRMLKRLLVSLMAAALVMGNVAVLTTFTARAEENETAEPTGDAEAEGNIAEPAAGDGTEGNMAVPTGSDEAGDNGAAASEIVVSVTPAADVVVTKAPEEEKEEASITPAPKQIVTAGGAVLEGDALNAVNEFLESLEVTEDFAVYADEFTSQCNHVEGNIAVNTLNSQTGDGMLIKVGQDDNPDGDQYSYIGNSEQSVGSYSPVILTNGELEESTQTSNTEFVAIEGALDVDAEGGLQVDEEVLAAAIGEVNPNIDPEDVAQAIKIDENLNRISDAAENLDTVLDEVLADEAATPAKTAVTAVTNMLTENTVQKGDVVVIDIPALGINDLCNEFQALYNANKAVGATLLVRVNAKETDSTISITIPLNGDYKNSVNGYLIWDFGAFNGKIVQNQAIAGVIVAPNAMVESYGTVEGRVVAGNYFHDGSEVHQPGKEPEVTPTETPDEEPTPTPTEEPEVTPTETPDEEPTPTPTEEPEVTPTETPNEEPTPTPTEEPEVTPTETPNEEPTPTPTEEPEVTPTETPNEEPTPTPTTTVTITDTPTPTSATPTPTTTVTITDTPVPLADTPEEGEVLGARRSPVVPEQGEVLGDRRAPQTGDTAETNLWLTVLFGAAAGLGTWAFLKKRDEKRSQAG